MRKRRLRLSAEHLEARRLLTADRWINSASGSWDVASNWSMGKVPGTSDDAVIDVLGSSPTVTIDTNVESVRSLTTKDPLLISGGGLMLAANSMIGGGLMMTGGTLTASGPGATVTVAGSTTVSGANLLVQNGGSLTLPLLASYTGGAYATDIQATGAGSVLSLPAAASINGSTAVYYSHTRVEALAGGRVDLPALTQVGGGAVSLVSDGAGSQLDAPALASFQVLPNFSSLLQTTGGGKLVGSGLTSLNDIDLTLDGTGSIATAQITRYTGGTLTLSGGTASLPALSDADSASFKLSGGATLTLPALASYANPLPYDSTFFQATGVGAVLSLPALTSLGALVSSQLFIQAAQGGLTRLPVLAAIAGPGQQVQVSADGVGSLVDLSALASFHASSGGLAATNHGTVLDGKLTSLDSVNVTLDGTGTLSFAQWASLTNGGLTATAGTYPLNLATIDGTAVRVSGGAVVTLPDVTSANSASFYVGGGTTLALPALASYANPIPYDSTFFQATGVGAVLSLPALASIGALVNSRLFVQAAQGGLTKLTALAAVAAPGQQVVVSADGADSLVDLSALASFALVFQVGNDGSLKIDTTVVTIPGSGVGATINLPQLPQGVTLTLSSGGPFTGGTIFNIPQGDAVIIPSGNFADGTTFNVAQSDLLDITGGTFAGGTTFNAAQSGSLDLEGGTFSGGTTFSLAQGGSLSIARGTYSGGITSNVAQTAIADFSGGTYSGTLTGSGAGTVTLDSTISVGLGGLIFNLPGNLFQWTGGWISSAGGDVTNLGTINLAGPSTKSLFNDIILDNFGTIIQTGTGNLSLHSDNQLPTVLKNELGATYLIESDSGVANDFGGKTEIDNAGTIRKTAGGGTSTILVPGPLNNTGTIEADSGTLYLNVDSIPQVTGNNLTAGTWDALNGSTLAFPNNVSISTNQAAITLDGPNAAFPAIQALSTNAGSLSITNGAAFSTAGAFTNNGGLTLGVGSRLTVKGNFTQGSAGSLTAGIGGSSASNKFGSLLATGSATLAGSVSTSLLNNYGPVLGDSYPIVAFASETGGDTLNFAGINGGHAALFKPIVNPTSIVLSVDTSDAQFVVQPPTVPTAGTVGRNFTVSYQVANQSGTVEAGDWTDSVYLATHTTVTTSSVLLGRVLHTGGVAANGQYTGTLTAPLPGLAPGNYHVIVIADSRGQVPQLNRAGDIAVSTTTVQVTLPGLTLGTPIQGTVDNNQDVYEQVTVAAGQNLGISASLGNLQGGELYLGYDQVPTSSTFDASSTSSLQTTQQVVIPSTQAGTYFILLHGDTGSTGGKPFTLTAQVLPLQISGTSLSQASNSGTTTLTIKGSQFTGQTTVGLVPHGGSAPLAATQISLQDSTTLFATFNLSGVAPGLYDIAVKNGSQTVTEPSAFTVTPTANPGHVSYNLSVPSISRPGRLAYLTLSYTNDGGSDAPAPLFVVAVTSGNAAVGLPGESSFSGSSVQLLGIENSGPAGTLPPGFQGTLSIPYRPSLATGDIQFSIQGVLGDSTPMDWASLKDSLRPSYIAVDAWDAIYPNFTAEVGATTADYVHALDTDATYLSRLGEYTTDTQRLFGFAINTANNALTNGSIDSVTDASFPVPGGLPLVFDRQFNASISGHYQMGPFGRGWTDNWQISASADALGNVTIHDGSALLSFAKNADGTYTPAPGEYGTLSLANGAYQYRQTDGTILAFNANDSLSYEQDTNANRITAGYDAAGKLTTLTASNGSAITIAYNAQGLISSITDPGNRRTTYAYDATGQHLLTFTDQFGATAYTYATGPNPADANGLTSLTFADGTGIQYAYDAQGRLATEGRLGGAQTVTHASPAPGENTSTDALGNTSASFHDDQGNFSQTIDGLGNLTRYVYDAQRNRVKTVASDGTTTTFAYDAQGNLTSETDPLGYVIRFTYNALGEPLTFVDQVGNTTAYAYDAAGNLLKTTYADGTTQQALHNATGEVTRSTNARGQSISYAYNPNGQLTVENLPDGTANTYTFDGHANILTAKGPGGNWSFTYNGQDLPTTIVEPYGTLNVKYGIDGNIEQQVDQTGFTVNYGYDPVGRLNKLSDAGGSLIVSYSYDAAGNLASELKGNGTSTSYKYNANGAIAQITNLAPGGSINSQLSYTYGSLGRVSSMTQDGVSTSYGYDADGQLVSAISPTSSLLYAYDPAGNRTSTSDNGVVTSYAVNNRDEYTLVGGTTYQYDADGNLIAATTSGKTTSYAFNAVNQLTGVTTPTGTFAYTYDSLGYRISSTINGATTNNLIDPFGLGNVAAQFDGKGNLVAHFTHGFGLVSQVSASGVASYYDFNLQGSTVGITNAAGAYVNQYSYDPFGRVTMIGAVVANPFRFVGQFGVSSDENGLIDMRARYFDVSTGQFASNDPLGLAAGDSNTRRYVGNNPSNSVDPMGLEDGSKVCRKKKLPIGYYMPRTDLSRTEFQHYAPQESTTSPPTTTTPGTSTTTTAPSSNQPPPITNFDMSSFTEDDSSNGCGCGCPDPPPPPPPPPPGPPGPPPTNPPPSGNQPSHDPNDLLGPTGFGPSGFLTPVGSFGYTIEFSNDKTAAVPADNVVVTEPLSPNLDWSTFQLGTIGFGSYAVNVPANLTSYHTRVDATATLGVLVDINASFNLATGMLTVTFASLDPATLDTPSNPLVGFLPPDKTPPIGEGSIQYAIQPKAGLPTGTAIRSIAAVVFDTNAAITTDQVDDHDASKGTDPTKEALVTIDAAPPTSTVAALPALTTSPRFTVSWSGSDGTGSGIATYNVYASDNGGPATLFQAATTATSATFTGQFGHSYSFTSVATDHVGNVQPTPSTAQATTKLVAHSAADFDGDGKADLAVYRPTTAQWLVLQSTAGPRATTFGSAQGDIPLVGDFDGDGKQDLAVYRPSTGQWLIVRSTAGPEVIQFGASNLDIPVPMDYDGDGKTDLAVYRSTTGQWLILRSTAGPVVYSFGAPSLDVPVPMDYDGDGKADLAVYRPTTGQWLILRSTAGPIVQSFGAPNLDIPVPQDYDGDGKVDLAVYRPTTGQWLILQSTAGPRVVSFGEPNLDVPLAPPLAYRYGGSLAHSLSASRKEVQQTAPVVLAKMTEAVPGRGSAAVRFAAKLGHPHRVFRAATNLVGPKRPTPSGARASTHTVGRPIDGHPGDDLTAVRREAAVTINRVAKPNGRHSAGAVNAVLSPSHRERTDYLRHIP